MGKRRLKWLALAVLLWCTAIFGKLFVLQVLHHARYLRMAHARQELTIELAGPRGTLLDRTGQVLAMSTPAESVSVNPLKVPDLEIAAGILGRVLHLPVIEVYGQMRYAREHNRGFLWVKRKIEPEEARHVRELGLDWISIQRESQRHYPNGALAAHVLGSVDFEEKGTAGIEKAMDARLRGEPGLLSVLTDVKRRGLDSELIREARPGVALTLTIDDRIQYAAERYLAPAVEAHHAVSGSVVVMDVRTGDVLAMASYPPYDPNIPPRPGESVANRQNHAVSVPFEPGSVFKIMTLSAALETTNLTPDTPIDCHGGVLRLPGRIIHDSHLGLGVIPMRTVLAKSSNIGAIQVGMRVGQQNMYEYVRRFGFGQRTGIQLPAESPGKLRKLNRWGTTSLASVSMGQEVSVTTLQLARAGCVIASGGLLIKPRLVAKIGDQPVPVQPPVRIVKPDTALTMQDLMEGVVLHGTGGAAKLVGYTVGGKTGSAQIFDVATHHYTHTYNGSFLGFAPRTNPVIVVVVTLNGTHGNAGFGGAAAAPVFKTVAAEALRVLDVPKDMPDEPPAKTLVASLSEDDVAEGDPQQPNILEEADDEESVADSAGLKVEDAGPRLPNFKGMTMSAVLAQGAALGVVIQPEGSGVARVQAPAAGSVIRPGERIRVQFAK